MKILAIEHEVPGIFPEQYQILLKSEAQRAWELMQSGVLRELYFRTDQHTAVLILECTSINEAQSLLVTLPLVEAGFIPFEVIPLSPYDGFERLFDSTSHPQGGYNTIMS